MVSMISYSHAFIAMNKYARHTPVAANCLTVHIAAPDHTVTAIHTPLPAIHTLISSPHYDTRSVLYPSRTPLGNFTKTCSYQIKPIYCQFNNFSDAYGLISTLADR